jgi:heat shock protein HtpX
VYQQITSNKRKSLVLLGGFILLYAAIGWVLSLWFGEAAFYIALGIALVMVIVNLYAGDDLVLAVSGAERVESKDEAPELWRKVENLSMTAGLPMPRLYIVPDDSPNAFAAGRKPEQAIVAVTKGLLERLDEEELEGVLAHEVSHVRNYDVRLMTYAAVLAGSIAMISQIFLRGLLWGGGGDRDGRGGANPIVLVVVLIALILAPIAAIVIQTAISRRREYVADASAVELTRYPQGLASALRVISGDTTTSARLSNGAIAHMMIAQPLSARGRVSRLFATHPPIEDRIARLETMAAGQTHRHGLPTAARRTAAP